MESMGILIVLRKRGGWGGVPNLVVKLRLHTFTKTRIRSLDTETGQRGGRHVLALLLSPPPRMAVGIDLSFAKSFPCGRADGDLCQGCLIHCAEEGSLSGVGCNVRQQRFCV